MLKILAKGHYLLLNWHCDLSLHVKIRLSLFDCDYKKASKNLDKLDTIKNEIAKFH